MIRKLIIAVLTLGAFMTMVAWVLSYRLEFLWYRYDSQLWGTCWAVSWDGGRWWTSVDGRIGDRTMDHVYLTVDQGEFADDGGTFEIHSQRQLPRQAKIATHGFDWQFVSYQYGIRRTRHRGGFHRFRQYRSTFAVPFVVLSAYPAIVFIGGSLRRWRRRRRGLCAACGYNLTGNTTGVCSECGAAFGRA